MAVDTEKTLRNQVLYSIYVRNYSLSLIHI